MARSIIALAGFVGAASGFTPSNPTEPGCWMLLPSGCPARNWNPATDKWLRDSWSEENMNTLEDADACERRQQGQRDWCGAQDVRTYHVPIPSADCEGTVNGDKVLDACGVCGGDHMSCAPKRPGCHMLLPSGCPNQKWDPKPEWYRDSWGEENQNTLEDAAACERRQQGQRDWCGAQDVLTHHVPMPPLPTTEGCWMLLPTGCPEQPQWLSPPVSWFRDNWSEENQNTLEDAAKCEGRQQGQRDWCGAQDILTHHVAPAEPTFTDCDNIKSEAVCSKHAAKDRCHKNNVKKNCAKSCGLCQDFCQDKKNNCQKKQKRGKCDRKGTQKKCPVACGLCRA